MERGDVGETQQRKRRRNKAGTNRDCQQHPLTNLSSPKKGGGREQRSSKKAQSSKPDGKGKMGGGTTKIPHLQKGEGGDWINQKEMASGLLKGTKKKGLREGSGGDA